jgi:hypothetical protein
MRALFWKIPRNYRRCGECSGFTLIPKLTPEELNELYSDYYLKALLTANGLKIEKQRISETWWPAPRSISSLKTLPKVVPQIVAKLLNFIASFFLPSYGSRFWLVASKSIQ